MASKRKAAKPVRAWAVLHVEPGFDPYLMDGDDVVVRGSRDLGLRDRNRWCVRDGCKVIPVIIADARYYRVVPRKPRKPMAKHKARNTKVNAEWVRRMSEKFPKASPAKVRKGRRAKGGKR